MTPRPLTMAPVDWLMLLALSILWGGAFFLNKLALAEAPPLTVALARVGVWPHDNYFRGGPFRRALRWRGPRRRSEP